MLAMNVESYKAKCFDWAATANLRNYPLRYELLLKVYLFNYYRISNRNLCHMPFKVPIWTRAPRPDWNVDAKSCTLRLEAGRGRKSFNTKRQIDSIQMPNVKAQLVCPRSANLCCLIGGTFSQWKQEKSACRSLVTAPASPSLVCVKSARFMMQFRWRTRVWDWVID